MRALFCWHDGRVWRGDIEGGMGMRRCALWGDGQGNVAVPRQEFDGAEDVPLELSPLTTAIGIIKSSAV